MGDRALVVGARRRYLISQPNVRSTTQRRFTTCNACGLVRRRFRGRCRRWPASSRGGAAVAAAVGPHDPQRGEKSISRAAASRAPGLLVTEAAVTASASGQPSASTTRRRRRPLISSAVVAARCRRGRVRALHHLGIDNAPGRLRARALVLAQRPEAATQFPPAVRGDSTAGKTHKPNFRAAGPPAPPATRSRSWLRTRPRPTSPAGHDHRPARPAPAPPSPPGPAAPAPPTAHQTGQTGTTARGHGTGSHHQNSGKSAPPQGKQHERTRPGEASTTSQLPGTPRVTPGAPADGNHIDTATPAPP